MFYRFVRFRIVPSTALSDRNRFLFRTSCFCLLVFVVSFCGCDSNRQPTVNPIEKVDHDYLQIAMLKITNDNRFNASATNDDVADKLNNWAQTYQSTSSWKKPETINTLPTRLQHSEIIDDLDKIDFTFADSIYIQEADWARNVAGWVLERKSPGDFRYLIGAARSTLTEAASENNRSENEALANFNRSSDQIRASIVALHPNISDQAPDANLIGKQQTDVDKLTDALKLFDWSVRNVQLSRMPREPTTEQIRENALNNVPGGIASLRGVPGPGYQRLPWHLFSNGYGDAWERARLAIRLMRQRKINAAMLAVPNLDDESKLDLWAIGVLIGDEVFLFDPALGLPIPGKNLSGIATLSQVRADPKLLSTLDLKPGESQQDIDYPINRIQLSKVTALLDAAPESISKKMAEIDDALIGKEWNDFQLKYNVDNAAALFAKAQGIDDVRLWDIPFLASEFRKAVEAAQNVGSQNLIHLSELKRESILDMKVALINEDETSYDYVGLSQARHRFLLGRFQSSSNSQIKGAARLFEQLRITDEEINGFETNDEWKSVYGLHAGSTLKLNAEEQQSMIQEIKMQFRFIRVDALYFLALSYYENELASNALSLFDIYVDTAMKGDPEWSQWQFSTEYMKGRCHENLMQFDEAIESYMGEVIPKERGVLPPQYFGNILRARLLRKWYADKITKVE